MIPRLLEKYRKEIVPQIMQARGYKTAMRVPRLKKIVINMGLGLAAHDIKILETCTADLGKITGQKPVICRAKKDISNFKIRRGLPVGAKVTLRKNIMYEFLDRFVNVALPRIRDFKGVSDTSFDENGNYSLGVQEQAIFPEIEVDRVVKVQGMDITIVTNAKSKEETRELLTLFGFPFVRR